MDDQLEILITESDGACHMTSHWIFLDGGAAFSTFAPAEWNKAYRELRRMEDDA
jgi:hypothetical protein